METWKPIPNYEELYLASSSGEVKRIKKSKGAKINKILKPYLNKSNGYYYITLTKNCVQKNFYLHKIIIKSFLGESNLQVNHIDGNKKNNSINNLEYVTSSQNMYHATRVLNKRSKENHWNSKLKSADILEIKKLKNLGLTQKAIAEKFNVSRITICNILNNKTWVTHDGH